MAEHGLFASIIRVVLLWLVHTFEDKLGIDIRMGLGGALVARSGLPLSFVGELVRDI